MIHMRNLRELSPLVALALAAALVAVACSSGGGSPPALVFDKTYVRLGYIERGSQATVTFLAINYGALPIDVGPVEVAAVQGEKAGQGLQKAVSLSAGSAFPVPVTIGPFSQLGPYKLNATVTSSDPKAPATELTMEFLVVEGLSQAATGPLLKVDKQLIDAGHVPYDRPLYEQFTLRNDGDAPLTLDGLPLVRTELGC
ncbi:MAG: hypothetical protein HY532_00930 [Chloroflexi bacterium]|nr:hypothetical protein [Chloroflexota bacterium]